MPKAYIVFIREEPIADQAKMDAYIQAAIALPDDPNRSILAAYGAIEALEGKEPDAAVVMEFPSVQSAKDWYNGPYNVLVADRLAAAPSYRGFIIEGR